MRALPYLNSPPLKQTPAELEFGGGGCFYGRKVGEKYLFYRLPPTRSQLTHEMFIALEDCLVGYDCHVESGSIMLGLLIPADG